MIVRSTRFGDIPINQDQVYHLESGIIGFPDKREYTLVEDNRKRENFYWLQSLDDPSLAFYVLEGTRFLEQSYKDTILNSPHFNEIVDISDLQVFLILNVVNDDITVNLIAPVVFNCKNNRGCQFIFSLVKKEFPHLRYNVSDLLKR